MEQKHNLTIDDIARELQVSKTTVSRAISGKGRISESTRARVLEYINEHNYRPSAAAKALAESRTYNLALVLPRSFINLDLPYIRQSMYAICEEAFFVDYNIMVCLSTDDSPAALLRTLDNRKVDGVILSRTVENDNVVEILSKRNIPFATMGSLPPAYQGCAIVETDHDQVGGCRAFTAEFLRGSSGRVALLGNDINYIVNQSRLSGFRKAVRDLQYPQDDVTVILGLNTMSERIRVVQDLLRQGVRQFLAMDDAICLDILTALKASGLRIPEDVRLASLCDSDQLCACEPAISSLSFDAAGLGRTACRELLHYLRGEEYDPTPTLGYRILMRESC
jgi:DNA-binding LacI/PurR family transcriptional regulator